MHIAKVSGLIMNGQDSGVFDQKHIFILFCFSSITNIKHPLPALRQYLRQILGFACPSIRVLLFSVIRKSDQSCQIFAFSSGSNLPCPCSRLTCTLRPWNQEGTVVCSDATSPPVLQDSMDSSTLGERGDRKRGKMWVFSLLFEHLSWPLNTFSLPEKAQRLVCFFLWGTFAGTLKDIVHDHIQTSTLSNALFG